MRTFLIFQTLIVLTVIWFSDHLQHYLVIAGFSWTVAAWLHYLLLFGNLTVLVFSLFTNGKPVQMARLLVCGLNVCFGLLLLLSYSTALAFLQFRTFTILMLALSVLGSLSLFRIKASFNWLSIENRALKIISSIVLVGICVAITLVVRKPYYEDYIALPKGEVSSELELHHTTETFLSDVDRIQEEGLMAFVTTSCPHCKRITTQLEAARISGNYTSTYLVIGGNPTKAADFIRVTGYTGSYVNTLNDTAFFEMTKGRVPKIFHFKNGSFDEVWNGNNFNYRALDRLSNR